MATAGPIVAVQCGGVSPVPFFFGSVTDPARRESPESCGTALYKRLARGDLRIPAAASTR
jgi:hypothetical protein